MVGKKQVIRDMSFIVLCKEEFYVRKYSCFKGIDIFQIKNNLYERCLRTKPTSPYAQSKSKYYSRILIKLIMRNEIRLREYTLISICREREPWFLFYPIVVSTMRGLSVNKTVSLKACLYPHIKYCVLSCCGKWTLPMTHGGGSPRGFSQEEELSVL